MVPKLGAGQAGLPEDFHFHDLRHRRVTRWLEAGGDIHKVSKAMGHSSLAVTKWYEHMDAEALQDLPGCREDRPEEKKDRRLRVG
ncbi:tyrosine-type recombinase/integrase [Gemmatimonadota bacterium]